MKNLDLSKKVVAAAVCGLFAGVTATTVAKASPGDKNQNYKEDEKKADANICKGHNACKGKGADGKNECKGKGACASASAKHECKGKNACKGLGGCKSDANGCAGKNECKGKGGCAVPVKG